MGSTNNEFDSEWRRDILTIVTHKRLLEGLAS